MKNVWKRLTCLFLSLLMLGALLCIPTSAEESGILLSCSAFEIKDGAAKGIVEIVNVTTRP